MNGKLILLVEDNKKLQGFNKRLLEGQGFSVETAMSLTDARAFLEQQTGRGGHRPAAIILDRGMPDGDGLSFLKELRQASRIPVLMLTGYKKDTDIITGYKSGCDDYVTKPYTFEVLLAKLNRLIENAEQAPETVARGKLTLKITSMTALLGGVDLMLTPKDFALLHFFVQNEERFMGADHLYEKVWGQPMANDNRAVKVAASRLRSKLEGSGYTISFDKQTGGYCFEKEK